VYIYRYIAAYLLCTETGGCTNGELKKMLLTLRAIEDGFYHENKPLNVEQNPTFEERKKREAEAMKNYAIPSKLI
jgi:hypothetical protein